MGNKEIMYKDLIAFHPGSYVEEIIEDLNITQKEFADRLGTSAKTVSKLVNGEESISKETANKLSKLTGISIETWMNLQTAYDVKVIEMNELKNIDEVEACSLIDFSYFKKFGFVEKRSFKIEEKIQELRKLLNISSLSYLFDFNSAVSYRNTLEFSEKSIVNSNVMLELASNKARNRTENKFSQSKLEYILPTIREMTTQDPDEFYPMLKKLLLGCGIVLVGMPSLTNANLNGATKKFKNGSVLVLITDRNKRSDIFWFSLFHELAHVIFGDFYSDLEDERDYTKKEAKADEFAQNFLIPHEKFQAFITVHDLSDESIVRFSEEIRIHPSIIVGRLQKEGLLKHNEKNHFRVNYNFDVA